MRKNTVIHLESLHFERKYRIYNGASLNVALIPKGNKEHLSNEKADLNLHNHNTWKYPQENSIRTILVKDYRYDRQRPPPIPSSFWMSQWPSKTATACTGSSDWIWHRISYHVWERLYWKYSASRLLWHRILRQTAYCESFLSTKEVQNCFIWTMFSGPMTPNNVTITEKDCIEARALSSSQPTSHMLSTSSSSLPLLLSAATQKPMRMRTFGRRKWEEVMMMIWDIEFRRMMASGLTEWCWVVKERGNLRIRILPFDMWSRALHQNFCIHVELLPMLHSTRDPCTNIPIKSTQCNVM